MEFMEVMRNTYKMSDEKPEGVMLGDLVLDGRTVSKLSQNFPFIIDE